MYVGPTYYLYMKYVNIYIYMPIYTYEHNDFKVGWYGWI